MASLFGAACGLLAFAAMTLRGLIAGNEPQLVLLRALGGLFGFLVIGTIAGWIAERVLNEKSSSEDDPEQNTASSRASIADTTRT